MEAPSTCHDSAAPSLWRDISLSTIIAGAGIALLGS